MVWSDNETEIDLLGFEYLVDELLVALTNKSLLPLTVGVLGEWGSGKSSLLTIAKSELDATRSPSYITVAFSPWQHEDYDDIKLALMKSVLDACENELGDSPQLRGLKKFLRVMGSIGRRAARVGVKTAAYAVSTAAVADGSIDPQSALILSRAASTTADVLDEEFSKETEAEVEPITSLEAFRASYESLVDQLTAEAVVVFIDDLDRCLPNTVVDTFEAIRLFLNAPKTAFVVAVHRELAEAAVDAAFFEYGRLNGRGLGHDYLEKMLQLQITVPRLSDDDAASYVGLLLAGLHLPEDEHAKLVDASADRRAQQPFERSFSLQFAAQYLGDKMTVDLRDDLEWAESIVPLVNGVLRANPRQIKRFLNDLRLRQGAALRRGVKLKPSYLAKLLALHEADFEAFQTLFDWQLPANGPIPQLRAAETRARTPIADPAEAASSNSPVSPATALNGRSTVKRAKPVALKASESPSAVEQYVQEWMNRDSVKRWLTVDPMLGGEDVRPYFTYFRSKLVVTHQLTKLPASLHTLVVQLSSQVASVRRTAADQFAGLVATDQQQVWTVIESYLRVRPDGVWWDAAAEVTERAPGYAPSLVALLTKVPESMIPSSRVFTLISRLPEGPETSALLAKWQVSPIAALSTAAGIAAKKGA